MLSQDRLCQLKSRLMEDQENIKKRIERSEHLDLENASVHEALSELSSYDNHPADHGTELYFRSMDIAMNDLLEEQLADIDRALQAMLAGTYGQCDVCGKDIGYERLDALPTTTRCIEHTPDTFVSENRPVEEEILRPAYGRFEYDEKDATMYDAEDAWQEVERYGTSDTPFSYGAMEKTDYADEMFIESDDPVGYVETIEGFITTDITGTKISVSPNALHRQYENMLDEAGILSIVNLDDDIDDEMVDDIGALET